MERLYAQALWTAIEKGRSPKEAVESLLKILKRQGREDLMPRIKRAILRLAEANRATRPKVFVAHEKDGKHALSASGINDADIVVDESLIGGWRYEGNDEIIDRSFKKYLLDIYTSSIAA
jgi:F0F1-type ATP synthase delta subunit